MPSTSKQTQGAHQPISCMPLGFIFVAGSTFAFYKPIPGYEYLTSHVVESYNLPSEVHTFPSNVHTPEARTLPPEVRTLPPEVHTLPPKVHTLPEICVPEHPILEEVRPDNSKSSSTEHIALETKNYRSCKRKRTTTVVSNDNFNITPAAPLPENQSFESATEPDDTMLDQFSLPSQGPSASHTQARELSNMYEHDSLPCYGLYYRNY